jgi:hypothetical protein
MTNLIHSRISRIEAATASAAEIHYQIIKYTSDLMQNQNEENDSARERLSEILKALDGIKTFVAEMVEISEAEIYGSDNFYTYRLAKERRNAEPLVRLLRDDEAI